MSAINHGATKLNVALNSTQPINLTPPVGFGASIVCQKHTIFLVFAKSVKEAWNNFYDNKYFRLDSGDYYLIQPGQKQSGINIYAIGLGSNESLANVTKNVPVVDGGTVPERAVIQTNANHGLIAREFVVISGTVSYNGIFEILATTALDKITINHRFIIETPNLKPVKKYPTVEVNYLFGD